MADRRIAPGTPLVVRDAKGGEHDAIATSIVEHSMQAGRKVHDFTGVWVRLTTKGDPVFWPLDDVRRPDGEFPPRMLRVPVPVFRRSVPDRIVTAHDALRPHVERWLADRGQLAPGDAEGLGAWAALSMAVDELRPQR